MSAYQDQYEVHRTIVAEKLHNTQMNSVGLKVWLRKTRVHHDLRVNNKKKTSFQTFCE